MIFDHDQILRMSEDDVREEIITQILIELGYKFGAQNYCFRSTELPSPDYYIGHKSKKDFPIGRPDYRCGVSGRRGSFIVEAKHGGHKFSKHDIEQAHSYAAHFEIGANFFVLCNGIEFQIFETLSGVDAKPVVVVANSELSESFHKISNVLSPDKLGKLCKQEIDLNLGIAKHFPSQIVVLNGWYRVDQLKLFVDPHDRSSNADRFREILLGYAGKFDLDLSVGVKLPLGDGRIFRNIEGAVVVEVLHESIHSTLEHNNKAFGLTDFVARTNDTQISTNPSIPSIFESSKVINVAKGDKIFERTRAVKKTTVEVSLDAEHIMQIRAYLKDYKLRGGMYSLTEVSFPIQSAIPDGVELPNLYAESIGEFELKLQKS